MIIPTFGGSFEITDDGTPSWVATSRRSSLTSIVTTPLPVEMPKPGLVLEHLDELLLRGRARSDEELLESRLREQELDALGGRFAQGCSSGPASGLKSFGSFACSWADMSTLS